MSVFKPFKGFRPQKDIAAGIACRPYDVLNSEEAKDEAKDNSSSFLHVTKPEIDLPDNIDIHSDIVYAKGKQTLEDMINDGVFVQDQNKCFYIYAQTMDGRTQYGLVGCSSVDDYLNNIIKKHELTRPDKEDDRMNHIRITNFNAEPVFFAYPDNQNINNIVSEKTKEDPIYDFTTADKIRHQLWMIDKAATVQDIENTFMKEIPFTYVADGHHRTAAAARVGLERRKNNPGNNGNEEYNFFMTVLFPASQLKIIDYNRVVTDLNGFSKDEFIDKLKENFLVEKKGTEIYKPSATHNFSMYIDGEWYSLSAKENSYNDNDPIKCLDVTVLSDYLLAPVLNITDLRKSNRIDFVGGIRGLGELKKRVDSGQMAAAFALYPVSMKQLFDIADTDNIMPPKTTWFEPKLRSGLVLHCLE